MSLELIVSEILVRHGSNVINKGGISNSKFDVEKI